MARSFSSRDRSFCAWRSGCGLAGGEGGRILRLLGGADISASLDDLQLDAAVLKLLFTDLIALLAALQLRYLHGVHLEKAVQLNFFAPFAVIIVVFQVPTLGFDDRGILPS